MSVLGQLVALPIKGYRRWISPILPPRCKFYPTCSTYAVEVLTQHGALKGSLLMIARLARCNPWAKDGVDMPPAPGRWRGEPVRRMSEEELATYWRKLDANQAVAQKGT